jgi:hypothetical protein
MTRKLESFLSRLRQTGSRAFRGEERLWVVWWGGGIPVALISAGMMITAERVRGLGTSGWGWGDAIDAARLLVYLAWALPAWHCSKNVERTVWTSLARVALAVGLAASAMF